ncbi:lysophospholipase [Candidatus Saccharibacteria bacterium]|nr:lysophospholipase [Candidatus Saccharibacteria bacterium]
MSDHIIIYSHGFGVRKDGLGLFTDIAATFPDAEHIMFDYNEVDKAKNALIVTPFDRQVAMLNEVFDKTRRDNPSAIIDLICHSQGGVASSLAKLRARKTILLAPPINMGDATNKLRKYFEKYPGTIIEDDGTAIVPRRDGSFTIIRSDYWQNYDELPEIPTLLGELNTLTDLTIIGATNDEVLGENNYSVLDDSIKIIEIESDHNFKNEARAKVIDVIKEVIK